MKSISIAAFRMPMPLSGVPGKLAVAAGATAFADWLFYGHNIGLSLALFLLTLAGISLLTSRVRSSRRQALIATTILAGGLAPVVEDFNVASALLGIMAVAIAVSSLTNPFMQGLQDHLQALRKLLIAGPFRLYPDIARSRSWSLSLGQLTIWIVPVLLSGIFLLLFASANPLIENGLAALNLQRGASHFNPARILFWIAMSSVVWPFIHVRWDREAASKPPVDMARLEAALAPPAEADPFGRELFGPGAILRSLVMFNVLFGVQTVLDLIYLWGGAMLPDGMTYATYAHRGAYPLMLTALLAAGFVLGAMAPGGAAERKPVIRILVFAWVAQNLMLVISSMLRLELYVEIYSLTYWRVAAFIWMLLVALGLVLIVARMAFNRSNRWLVMANLATLAMVFYACTLTNFPWMVATYNVTHSQEMPGEGTVVDFDYLVSLGPQALPAIDRCDLANCSNCRQQRDGLVQRYHSELDSWRAWSFRGWRLTRYLDQTADHSAAAP